ncbi:MAG: hypothetical protein KAQ65_05635 [Candidatus Thorarchaeota archaeon]|nr:hypothetical protein [Candidatus Thorarchaeota archaeon]MCK5238090.1 hypothetical protein [Candidatus Thorarchaeota archaeon]
MSKRFWQTAFLVSVLAILVSVNSLVPIFQMIDPLSSLQSAMLVLGGGVLLVSVMELIIFRNVQLRKQYVVEAIQPKKEIRTY